MRHDTNNAFIPEKQRGMASRCFRIVLIAAAAFWLLPASGSAARADEPGAQAEAEPAGPPWLGLIADRNWKKPGVLVDKVLRTSPAESAGLQAGDVVTVVNGKKIDKVYDFKLAMRSLRAGDDLTLTYIRVAESKETTLTLAPLPSQRDLIISQLMGRKAPAAKLGKLAVHGQGGKNFSIESLKGKPVVLDFWATWCSPCVPFTEQVQETAKAHKGEVHVISVSSEEKKTLLEHYKKKSAPAYIAAHDPDGIMHDAYFVRSYPMVIVLDADLKVRKVITGNDDPKLVEESVRALLAGSAR